MSTNAISFTELLDRMQTLFVQWYGPILYILIYFFRPVVFLPASLLAILAGNIWGMGLGFILGLSAGTLSAVLPYGFGRWFSSDGLAVFESKNWISHFINTIQKNPFQAVLTMRLLYLPYDTVSAVVGALRVSFTAFLLATAIGNILGTLSFVGIGAALEGDVLKGEISINPVIFVLSFVLLLISIGISRYLKWGRESNDV
ncbi:MAG: TVP38/TMEM64 family protein [Chloroflexi bacterium]|nr:MAG: TVP38/TMEM64 family protein [Chloroflexota bacterium]